ncbi:two-component regulator propeller domain-containing protein [Paraflavitalea pollutisoli]|uniref:sensor histidine kinase n=1 Tax=Paraflavitalea pollutisoli TaxID=3034143 RepID=UPI0023ED0A85|nr:two-component regulator propeller domain-containing protein [Paraflavitalea sp. H1-2-19X]
MQLDPKGYLWLITEAGLLRFDGQHFQDYYRLPDGNSMRRRPGGLFLQEPDTIVMLESHNRFYRPAALDSLIPYTVSASTGNKFTSGAGLQEPMVYARCFMKVRQKKEPSWIMPASKSSTLRAAIGLGLVNNRYYWFNSERELVAADTALLQFRRLKMTGFPVLKDSMAMAKMIWSSDKIYVQWGEFICIIVISNDGLEAIVKDKWHVGKIGIVTRIKELPGKQSFFIGTLADGLYQFTKKIFITKTIKGALDNVYYAQAPFGENGVVTEKGVFGDDRYIKLDSFRNRTILRLKDGSYILNQWLHNSVNGLVYFDSNFRRMGFQHEPITAVNCFFQSADGRVWVGAESQFLGELKNGQIRWMQSPDKEQFPLIEAMQEIGGGMFWVASYRGLARLNVNTGAFTLVPYFKGKGIRHLYLDRRGILWIGTYGSGLFALTGNQIVKLPQDPNRYLARVHAFMEDDHGYCWMSTNKGLFQARMSDLVDFIRGGTKSIYYHYYDKTDGFLTNEFNGGCWPSAIRTSGGLFSFPSMNGLVQFDPLKIEPAFSTNDIYIDQVAADSLIYPWKGQTIKFPAGSVHIRFAISSPYFGHPNNHFIEYQLQGADSTWNTMPADGRLNFDRLPHGEYALVVRKMNGFGHRMSIKTIPFTLQPVYYEKIWFKLFIALLLLAGIWLAMRLRYRYLARQQVRLEQEIVYRTKEQEKLIEELGATVDHLQRSKNELARHSRLLEMMSMTISHDLQSPLRFLTDVAGSLHENALQNDNPRAAELSRELLHGSDAIHRFVQEFGYWIKSQGSEFSINKESVVLSKLFNQLGNFAGDVMKQKGNVFSFDIPLDLCIETDRQLLQIVLRNLIDNANKYTSNGQIKLAVITEGALAHIVISDTGRGFQTHTLERVKQITHDPFNSLSAIKGNSGYGYYFISAFCKLLNVEIIVANLPGNGAVITLSNFIIFRQAD